MSIEKLISSIGLENLLGKRAVNSLIVADLSSEELRLINIELAAGTKITAFRSIASREITNTRRLIAAISSFVQENNIRHKNSLLIPSPGSFFIKRLGLPAMPQQELAEAIKWQLKDTLTFSIENAIIDYFVLKEMHKEDGSRILDCLCVAGNVEQISKQVVSLKQCGLDCVAVIPLPLIYAQFSPVYFAQGELKTMGLLYIGESFSFINVFRGNKLEFFREIPFSMNELKNALKTTLVSDKGRIELSAEEIEEVLFQAGIPEDEITYKDKLSSIQILSMLRTSLERLCAELRRSLTYYITQLKGEGVDAVFIDGLAAKVPRIDSFLAKEMSLNISKISLAGNAQASGKAAEDALFRDCSCVAAALIQAKGINLLPFKFRTEKLERLQKASLRLISFVSFLILALFYFFAKSGVDAYQKRLDNARLQLTVLSEIRSIKTGSEEFNAFIGKVRSEQPHAASLLKKLSMITGPEIFLNAFELNSAEKKGLISGLIKGSQNKEFLLTQFAKKLGGSVYFTNVSITSAQKRGLGQEEIIDFKINFTLP